MKTKDFIKMLQEADPSGECHVRMDGGVPYRADAKEGYYDGPYTYIDDEGNYVTSIKGNKVDIWCKDRQDFIYDMVERNKDISWDEVKKKLTFEFGGYVSDGGPNCRVLEILRNAEKTYHEASDMYKQFMAKALERNIQRAMEGWKWYQDKRADLPNPGHHVYYTWRIFDGRGKDCGGSNLDMTEAVLKSGLWEKRPSKIRGYNEWVFIGEQTVNNNK